MVRLFETRLARDTRIYLEPTVQSISDALVDLPQDLIQAGHRLVAVLRQVSWSPRRVARRNENIMSALVFVSLAVARRLHPLLGVTFPAGFPLPGHPDTARRWTCTHIRTSEVLPFLLENTSSPPHHIYSTLARLFHDVSWNLQYGQDARSTYMTLFMASVDDTTKSWFSEVGTFVSILCL